MNNLCERGGISPPVHSLAGPGTDAAPLGHLIHGGGMVAQVAATANGRSASVSGRPKCAERNMTRVTGAILANDPVRFRNRCRAFGMLAAAIGS